MKVVIIGAGEVGYSVIGSLYREGVDIVAVDTDTAVLEQLKAEFNVTTLLGNATDGAVLHKAGVSNADLFLAITNYDETNIISCMLAGHEGGGTKIARVKSLDIGQSFTDVHHFGIDFIINPYEVAAEHLEMLVRYPQVTDFNQFLSDQVLLFRVKIEDDSPLAGGTVMEFGSKAQIPTTLIALIQRQGISTFPQADMVIKAGDQVYFFCDRQHQIQLFQFLNMSTKPSRRVFINGGGHIGYALAKRLEKKNLDVRILEVSEQRCQELSQMLDNSLILHTDGSDSLALKQEGVDRADAFISVTSADQVNVVSCLLARELGTPRTVALVKQLEYIPIIAQRGLIDVSFSPRQLTARKILRFVRGQNLDSFFTFYNSDIELLELKILPGRMCEGRPLADLNLPEGVLIGAVKRGDEIFIPRGLDKLTEGDTILLLQQRRNRRITKGLFLEPPATTENTKPAGKTDLAEGR